MDYTMIERIVQSAELTAGRYLGIVDPQIDQDDRVPLLAMRDEAIEQQSALRKLGPGHPEFERGLMLSFRFLLARIEALIVGAIRDENSAYAAGEAMSEAIIGVLQVAVTAAQASRGAAPGVTSASGGRRWSTSG